MFIHHYLVEGIEWIILRPNIQGEKSRSSLLWLDPAMVTFHCKDVSFGEPFLQAVGCLGWLFMLLLLYAFDHSNRIL
jgi:hypothetical protein